MGSPGFNFAAGAFVSAGSLAAVNVICGFPPKYVKTFIPDYTNGWTSEWWEGIPDGTGIKCALVGGAYTAIATLGITPSYVVGATTYYNGFTVGTNCQYASTLCRWIAMA